MMAEGLPRSEPVVRDSVSAARRAVWPVIAAFAILEVVAWGLVISGWNTWRLTVGLTINSAAVLFMIGFSLYARRSVRR